MKMLKLRIMIYWNWILDILSLLKSKIRVWWHRLFIRRDEFHHSLDMDISAMLHMNQSKRDKYLKDLSKRRQVAHDRDFEQEMKIVRGALE